MGTHISPVCLSAFVNSTTLLKLSSARSTGLTSGNNTCGLRGGGGGGVHHGVVAVGGIVGRGLVEAGGRGLDDIGGGGWFASAPSDSSSSEFTRLVLNGLSAGPGVGRQGSCRNRGSGSSPEPIPEKTGNACSYQRPVGRAADSCGLRVSSELCQGLYPVGL